MFEHYQERLFDHSSVRLIYSPQGMNPQNLATKIGSEGVNLDKQAFNAS